MPNQSNICQCGCCGTTQGQAFIVGHANTLRARLVRESQAGNQASAAELTRRGWPLSYAVFNRSDSRFTADRQPVRQTAATLNASRKFGVEIEFTGCSAVAAQEAASALGLRVEPQGYNHNVTGFWKIVPDGSCGLELVSPPLQGEEGFDQIRKACQALRNAGAIVTVTCGLHVHLDASDFRIASIKRAVQLYSLNQDTINLVISRSRRENRYACRWISAELAQLNGFTTVRQLRGLPNRFKTVNLCAYPRYGTIEFRQHQGTHNAEKIIKWIGFCRTIMEAARSTRTLAAAQNLDRLLDWLNLNTEDRAYFTERAMELA